MPGNFQSATSNVPSGKSLMYFGVLLASGVFFIFIAFTMFLPVMVLVPQKFAICFTIGCAFIIGSFFALKGPKNQFAHMSSKEVQCFLSFTNSCVNPSLEETTKSLLVVLATNFSFSYLSVFFLTEAPFYVGIYWYHGWNRICLYGPA